MQNEPNIVTSSYSRRVTEQGIAVTVEIYRLEHETDWILEVVNAAGTSIVWDDPFMSDHAAYAEFQRTVEEEGMAVFLDDANVIPFPRRPRS